MKCIMAGVTDVACIKTEDKFKLDNEIKVAIDGTNNILDQFKKYKLMYRHTSFRRIERS